MFLSILIPVYNEDRFIRKVLDRLRTQALPSTVTIELVVVNDGSTDGTEAEVLRYQEENPNFPLRYFAQKKNGGKGKALHRAMAEAKGDYLLIQDADLEYDPNDIPALLEPVLKGKADVVYGSRFISQRPHRALYYWHFLGNRFLTTLTNMVTNLNLTDMETCYKLMRAEFVKPLSLRESRFGFEPEVTIKLARIPAIRFYEVGIGYDGRTFAEGKKIGWKDGMRAIWCIFRYGVLRLY